MNNEIKRININAGHFTEADYSFTIKLIFSTLGSIIGISRQGPVISFLSNDSIKDVLGFNAITLFEQYNLSQKLVDILSIDYIFVNYVSLKVWFFEVKEVK